MLTVAGKVSISVYDSAIYVSAQKRGSSETEENAFRIIN